MTSLFNGKDFHGWEGDTLKTWHVAGGAIVGGSLDDQVAHNEFLSTRKTYRNFRLRLKFKLTGSEGFINSGVQFHSKRIVNPAYEMVGYQADLGDKFWASLYDESRRNKTLAAPSPELVNKLLKPGDWNDYEIRSENGRIRIYLNGGLAVDYRETDKRIPQSGLIALQIHGGGKARVAFMDIFIEEM
ncbi:MAG TPA: DUF1080 domain-containing protein [Dyadobacter sp.]|nr:DUF1080 domain-containing protein [Dyadobacter sp.]